MIASAPAKLIHPHVQPVCGPRRTQDTPGGTITHRLQSFRSCSQVIIMRELVSSHSFLITKAHVLHGRILLTCLFAASCKN